MRIRTKWRIFFMIINKYLKIYKVSNDVWRKLSLRLHFVTMSHLFITIKGKKINRKIINPMQINKKNNHPLILNVKIKIKSNKLKRKEQGLIRFKILKLWKHHQRFRSRRALKRVKKIHGRKIFKLQALMR